MRKTRLVQKLGVLESGMTYEAGWFVKKHAGGMSYIYRVGMGSLTKIPLFGLRF